jgi:hypothetical protein
MSEYAADQMFRPRSWCTKENFISQIIIVYIVLWLWQVSEDDVGQSEKSFDGCEIYYAATSIVDMMCKHLPGAPILDHGQWQISLYLSMPGVYTAVTLKLPLVYYSCAVRADQTLCDY